ncbi:hypothetical protein ACF0H5_018989 [Mactra antiquata]
MKKYIQYNHLQYRDTQHSDLGSNLPLLQGKDIPVNSVRSPEILDLSGKQGNKTPNDTTKLQWTNEQETALDLSGYGKNEAQDVALDLSKPNIPKSDPPNKASYHHGNQAQRLVSTPPSPRHSKSPAGQQYSLLQAALNSAQPNVGLHQALDAISQSKAGLHPAFDTISQSTALLLQQRAMNFTTAGQSIADFSRAIKPFSTMSSRPLGFSMLHGPGAAGAVIQGVHKPIAITTPQPHNSSTDTKSQSVSSTTVSVTNASQSIQSTSNQSNYSSSYQTHTMSGVSPRKQTDIDVKRHSTDMDKKHDNDHVERYIIRSGDEINQHIANVNMVPPHPSMPGFCCTQCSKTFKTKAALKLHTTVHKTSEERQYGCTICNRRFLHKHHLVVHQRKHSGEKPFKCNACSKTFMAIFLLHKHLRKHSRETGPVSQISLEQLKQLHDKKLISAGSDPLPFIHDEPDKDKSPVIILDDDISVNATVEIKINENHGDDKDKKILEIIGNNQKMILDKLKADIMTKGITKESVTKSNTSAESSRTVTPKKNVRNTKPKTVTEIQTSKSDSVVKTETVDLSDTSGSVDSGMNYNYILKDDSEEESKTSVLPEVNKVNNQENNQSKSAISETQESLEICKPDPVPLYGSDDEVELDFITGEITIIGKKKSAIENEKVKVKTDENKLKDIKMEEVSGKSDTGNNEETVKQVLECLVDQTVESTSIDIEKLNESASKELKVEEQKNVAIDNLTDNQESEESEESNNIVKSEGKNDIIKNVENIDNKSSDPAEDMDTNETNSVDKELDEEGLVVVEAKVEGTSIESSDTMLENKSIQKVSIQKENNAQVEATIETKDSSNSAEVSHSSGNENSVASKSSNDEDRNIFDKLTEMRDMEELKTSESYVEKEVELILKNIKRVVCKDGEEDPVVIAKKPKTDNVNIKNPPKLTPERDSVVTNKEAPSAMNTLSIKSKHSKGKKKGRKVKCEVCSRSFHSNHYLLLHMAVHKRNPMLQSLKKAKDFQMKAMGFVNKSNVSCEVCKKIFKFQKSLNSHMRVHSEKLIQTKLYRKAFRDFMAEAAPPTSRTCDKEKSQGEISGESESHSRHNSGDDHMTNVDSEIVNTSKDTSMDIEDEPVIKIVIGSDNVKRYLCHACDNTYTTKQKLRMHALIHKDNCFLCDICGKSFFRQITLEKHISTHKLPRPHVCEICKKTFIHRSSLMRHKVAHEKSAAPSMKQQVADRNFEMKMLDTYSKLKQERMQKLQMDKLPEKPAEQTNMKMSSKYDALDLSVKIKTEDQCLPPVLSPVITCLPNPSHSIPWNLSPPLITQENMNGRLSNDKTPDKSDRSSEGKRYSGEFDHAVVASLIDQGKTRTDSTCSESDTVTVEGHKIVQKRVRKTRVYPTSCRICKEVFPNVMLLKSHMAVHNTVETHLYECHICRHRFTQSCSLLRHLKTSCQENKMKCVPCGRTFHRRNTFEQHMKLHQGGPPNLDGSFYDKRPDEVAVHEERESDIENNNLSKVVEHTVSTQESKILPLTRENVNNLLKSEPSSREVPNNCDDDSEDARTYLYSEGEVHSRCNSDFSDNEWSPPQSPKKTAAPQDLSLSSANMTLNLLSAVCSDIRNAEKEKELKQKELEEKQKELETIEILANLKRGAMQKSMGLAPPSDNIPNHSVSIHPPVYSAHLNSVSFHSNKHKMDSLLSAVSAEQNTVNVSRSPKLNKSSVPGSSIGVVASSALVSPLPNTHSMKNSSIHQNTIPSIIDGKMTKSGESKIPTVVLEVAANAEGPRPSQGHRTWSGRSSSAPTVKEVKLPPEVPEIKVHYPAIHERLSLLMKAQVSNPMSLVSDTNKGVPMSTIASLSSTSVANMMSLTSPIRHVPSDAHLLKNMEAPQDLSVKKPSPGATISKSKSATTSHRLSLPPSSSSSSPHSAKNLQLPSKSVQKEKHISDIPRSNSSRSLPTDLSRSDSVEVRRPEISSAPPPLVPMFHCELCSRVLYSKTDLHLHMMEHGRSTGALYKMLHSNQLLSGKKPATQDSPIDFTKSGPEVSPTDYKQTVSPSLDLASKCSDKMVDTLTQSVSGSQQDSPGTQLKNILASASKISETLSPSGNSDFSDSQSLPSPSTPSGPGTPSANLDMLRQELRLKIYARRRSQGLDDLKVEFKQPEPTEMTEAEKTKLLYRRECNRQAAQRSRMRKKDLVDSLLEKLSEMPNVNQKEHKTEKTDP